MIGLWVCGKDHENGSHWCKMIMQKHPLNILIKNGRKQQILLTENNEDNTQISPLAV